MFYSMKFRVACILFFAASLAGQAEWWNNQWEMKKEIRLANPSGQELIKHPVVIKLSRLNLPGDINFNSLRIIDSGQEVPYQLDDIDGISGLTMDDELVFLSDIPHEGEKVIAFYFSRNAVVNSPNYEAMAPISEEDDYRKVDTGVLQADIAVKKAGQMQNVMFDGLLQAKGLQNIVFHSPDEKKGPYNFSHTSVTSVKRLIEGPVRKIVCMETGRTQWGKDEQSLVLTMEYVFYKGRSDVEVVYRIRNLGEPLIFKPLVPFLLDGLYCPGGRGTPDVMTLSSMQKNKISTWSFEERKSQTSEQPWFCLTNTGTGHSATFVYFIESPGRTQKFSCYPAKEDYRFLWYAEHRSEYPLPAQEELSWRFKVYFHRGDGKDAEKYYRQCNAGIEIAAGPVVTKK